MVDENILRELLMTPEQCKAARALAGLSQEQLALSANVGLSTVRNFEKGRSVPVGNNMAAIKQALTEVGVELIPENGGGPGVRLKRTS